MNNFHFFSRDFTGLPSSLSDSSLDGDSIDMNIERKYSMDDILLELANMPRDKGKDFLDSLKEVPSCLNIKEDLVWQFHNNEDWSNTIKQLPISEIISVVPPKELPGLFRYECPIDDCTFCFDGMKPLRNHMREFHPGSYNEKHKTEYNDHTFGEILYSIFGIGYTNLPVIFVDPKTENNTSTFNINCPIAGCYERFQNDQELKRHHNGHRDIEKGMSLFWSPILHFIREYNKIPTLEDLCKDGFLERYDNNGVNAFSFNQSNTTHIKDYARDLILQETTTFPCSFNIFPDSHLDTSLKKCGINFEYDHYTTQPTWQMVTGDPIHDSAEDDSFSDEKYDGDTTNSPYESQALRENSEPEFPTSSQRDQASDEIHLPTPSNAIRSEEDLCSFERHMIESLVEVNDVSSLIGLIEEWNEISIEHDRVCTKEDTPILTLLKLDGLRFPLPKYGCPYSCGEGMIKNLSNLRQHLRKEHTHSTKQYIQMCIEPITGPGQLRCLNEDGEILELVPHICPYVGCNHFSSSTQITAHMADKHKDKRSLYEEFGPFWAAHIDCARVENRLIHTGEWTRERDIFICEHENCDKAFPSLISITQHWRFHEKLIVNETPPHKHGKLCYVEGEIPTPSKPRNIPRPTNHIEATNSPAYQRIAREDSNSIENDLQIVNMSNEDLITQAKKWITDHGKEEDTGVSLPSMRSQRRKTLRVGLNDMFTNVWIPMLERYAPMNDSEDEQTKLDGVIYRINHEIRMHCCSALKLKPSKMQRKQRSSENNNEETIAAEKIKAIRNNTAKIVKWISEYYELSQMDNSEQTIRNRIGALENKLLDITENQSDEWCMTVFGGRSLEDIKKTLNEDIEHIEAKISWIKSKLDENIQNSKKGEINRLRDIYDDNPLKALNHYVWPKNTPTNEMNAKKIVQHYGPCWSTAAEGYESEHLDQTFKIPTILDDLDNAQLLKDIIDVKNIESIINSRNHISAHGRDAISYAIFKLCSKNAAKFFSVLFRSIIKTGLIPESWKTTRTVMLYKKGDANKPENWRPIGITSTVYRIFTCSIARSITNINRKTPIFNDAQKGFISGNGCSEHITILNELCYNATRTESEIHLMAIDFSNAFGSVPHDLIFDVLQRKGFGNEICRVVRSIYENNFTTVEVNGTKSERLPWRRGVIQGCPLSPILFNCALDPLLWKLTKDNQKDGVIIRDRNGNEITINAQAYADDVVLVSPTVESMNNLIYSTRDFAEFSKLTVAPQKCISMSKCRNATPTFLMNNQEIPAKDIGKCIRYLGAPISGSKASRVKYCRTTLEDVQIRTNSVFNSNLTILQKLDAIKSYVLPRLDFLLENGQFAINDLDKLDRKLRGQIDREIRASGIPISFFYTSSSYGGLGLPKLTETQYSRQIKKYCSMLLSPFKKTRKLMKIMTRDETVYRGIEKVENSPFLDWKITNGELTQSHKDGTDCSVIQAFRAAKSLKVHVKMKKKTVSLRGDEDEETICNTPQAINKTLRGITRSRWHKELTNLPFHGHSFTTLADTQTSNKLLCTRKRKINDPLFKFIIRARTNTLPTPELIAKNKKGNTNPHCNECNNLGSLKHLINGCRMRMNKFKYRHNLIVDRLIKEIRSKKPNVVIHESQPITAGNERVEGAGRDLKPDIWYYENDVLNIIEVSVPYGELKDVEGTLTNSLESTFNHKIEKYSPLAQQCSTQFECEVKLNAIIVSSLGAIPKCTHDTITKMFDKTRVKKIEEGLSYDAIIGSAVIFWNVDPRSYNDTRTREFLDTYENQLALNEENEIREIQESEHEGDHQMASDTSR